MIVRVNDRGPFVDDRLIDLSYGAAVRLGFDQQGTARVRLEHIDIVGRDDWREHHGKGYRRLQVGAYQSMVAADTIARNVREAIGNDILVEVTTVKEGAREVYRVRLGPVGKAEDLDDVQALLDRNGLPKGQRLP
jgi:rare lipoprotein A